jgi:hypothetical protein
MPSVGEAGVRTVVPSFQLGEIRAPTIWERALARERKLSFARQDALTSRIRSAAPRLEAVGYGSYAGFADGCRIKTKTAAEAAVR